MQDGSSDVETEQSAATALMAAGTSSAVPAPAADVPAVVGNDTTAASTVLAVGENAAAGIRSDAESQLSTAVAHDGPVPSKDPRLNEEPSNPDPSDETSSAVTGLEASDGSDRDLIPSSAAATERTQASAVANAEERVSSDHAAPFGPSALHIGSQPVGAPGSAAVATGTATASAPAAATMVGAGPAEARAVSAEGVFESAEFPDGGAGTAAPTVDIDDLAASISRPLAGGSGEYSVQVSLHPPELGEVRALLSLQGDVLHVTLTPEHASGFDALSDAMPALHEQLAGGGVEVNVTLGQPGDSQGEDGWRPAHAGASTSDLSDDATQAVPPPAFPVAAGSPGRINLVL